MLYGFLVSLFVLNCLLLVLIILIQQGKGNMGLGNMGGGAQMLFGGSGGQDLFQKITWVLGTIFMAGSLILAIMKSHQPAYRYGGKMNLPVSSAPVVPGSSEPSEY